MLKNFICWNGPKSCQIQPKPVNSLPSQTQACALFLNLQAKPSQARNPFFIIQAKPSRLGLFLGDSKPAWWPLLRRMNRWFQFDILAEVRHWGMPFTAPEGKPLPEFLEKFLSLCWVSFQIKLLKSRVIYGFSKVSLRREQECVRQK